MLSWYLFASFSIRQFDLSRACSPLRSHVEYRLLRCHLTSAAISICAVPERRNPLTRYDFQSLMRHVGFALQNVLVTLSTAVRRKRHSSQRPGGRQDMHTIHSGLSSTPKPTFRPPPHPLDCARVRQTCTKAPTGVRGKAVCVLQSRRNMPSDARKWFRKRRTRIFNSFIGLPVFSRAT